MGGQFGQDSYGGRIHVGSGLELGGVPAEIVEVVVAVGAADDCAGELVRVGARAGEPGGEAEGAADVCAGW